MNKVVALLGVAILLLNLTLLALGSITPTTFWIVLGVIGGLTWWMKKKK